MSRGQPVATPLGEAHSPLHVQASQRPAAVLAFLRVPVTPVVSVFTHLLTSYTRFLSSLPYLLLISTSILTSVLTSILTSVITSILTSQIDLLRLQFPEEDSLYLSHLPLL